MKQFRIWDFGCRSILFQVQLSAIRNAQSEMFLKFQMSYGQRIINQLPQ